MNISISSCWMLSSGHSWIFKALAGHRKSSCVPRLALEFDKGRKAWGAETFLLNQSGWNHQELWRRCFMKLFTLWPPQSWFQLQGLVLFHCLTVKRWKWTQFSHLIWQWPSHIPAGHNSSMSASQFVVVVRISEVMPPPLTTPLLILWITQ